MTFPRHAQQVLEALGAGSRERLAGLVGDELERGVQGGQVSRGQPGAGQQVSTRLHGVDMAVGAGRQGGRGGLEAEAGALEAESSAGERAAHLDVVRDLAVVEAERLGQVGLVGGRVGLELGLPE